MKDLLKREFLIWVQYFLITCVAAVVGHYVWESSQSPLSTGAAGELEQINVREMILHLWRDYYRWVLGAFIILSAVRLLLVLFFGRARLKAR